jgi:hypothetical protein
MMLAVVLVALGAVTAGAEHRVENRFVVLGYVKDAAGHSLADRGVSVVRDRTGFSYVAETDATGLYVAVTRLGDESAGETLTVRIGGAATRIVARFDPANHREERGTRVDLEGARFVERPAAFRATLARFMEHRPAERTTR